MLTAQLTAHRTNLNQSNALTVRDPKLSFSSAC
jgi:hypothetical protein